jgi:hypothetical protein
MFFNRCRFGILRHLVNHSRTSYTAHREVVAATPTIQMMTTLLDIFRKIASGIVIDCWCFKLCDTTVDMILCCESIDIVRGREWIVVQWMICIAYGGVLL